MTHVRNDHGQIGEIDQHVFEEVGVLYAGTNAWARDAGVDRERRVLRKFANLLYLAARARRITDSAGNEEAAGVRVADVEQLRRVAVEATGEDAGRDAEVVHLGEQLVDADRAAVAAEVAGN